MKDGDYHYYWLYINRITHFNNFKALPLYSGGIVF